MTDSLAQEAHSHSVYEMKVRYRAPEELAAIDEIAKLGSDAIRVLTASCLLPTEYLAAHRLGAQRPR